MHEIEPSSFCTIEEYRRFFENRKQASDISLGGLYLVLADIRSGKKEKKAFKFPLRVKVAEQGGVLVVRIVADLLDQDLQPIGETSFEMTDGVAKRPGLMESSTSQSVNEMYIRDYEDYLDLGPGEGHIEEELVSKELVLA